MPLFKFTHDESDDIWYEEFDTYEEAWNEYNLESNYEIGVEEIKMKCPGCGEEGAKYKVRIPVSRKKDQRVERTDFNAEHKCGWEGIIN